MAKNKKLQRAEKSVADKAAERAAEAARLAALEAEKAAAKAAHEAAEATARAAAEAKKKEPRKKHVRPPKREQAVKVGPLFRGSSLSAKTMSARVAKSVFKDDDKDREAK
jgi:hypothetical protein